jgi:hypothetical protein
LIHHPVLDRQRDVVTTAITNLDLHDISRSAHTFGLSEFFVVHPIAAQRELAERVRSHWVDGSGARRIPDRRPAMELVRVVPDLDAVTLALGERAEWWVTSAAPGGDLDFRVARELVRSDGPPILLCFGTGWGLDDTVLARADRRLGSIASPRADGYNHLSVRAAAAIVFDRLLGDR